MVNAAKYGSLLTVKSLQEKSPRVQGMIYADGKGKLRKSIFSTSTSSTHWGYHRKGIAKFFTPKNLKLKEEFVIQYTKEVMDEMKSVEKFNIEEEMIKITSNICII